MQKCKLNFLLRFGLISILLGLFVTQSFAQNVTITGVVKDQSGEPLIGVNVMEKGTTNGSITDVDGKYSVSVKGGKTILVFSYIGYISQEIPVGNQKTLNVTMKEDTEELEEVVVIGYGTAKKKDLTGAISRVKAEKMEVEALVQFKICYVLVLPVYQFQCRLMLLAQLICKFVVRTL